MHLCEYVVGLLVITSVLALISHRYQIPYPILLVVSGAGLGFVPHLLAQGLLWTTGLTWTPPVWQLDPQLVFLLFLPPLLYAAAFLTVWTEFYARLRAITLLAVGLVFVSTFAVAAVGYYVFELPWTVGCVLGAIVSPPDAVAAAAITQRLRVPRIITTILEGESLINDASGLVAYRFAVAAVTSGVFVPEHAAVEFAFTGGCGIIWGLVMGWTVVRFHRWLRNCDGLAAPVVVTITLLTPYLVYLPAEHLHISGVLAVVTAGLFVGRQAEELFAPDLLKAGHVVWQTVEYLLNSLIFILIGLQLPAITQQLDDRLSVAELIGYPVWFTLTLIIVRIVWVIPMAYLPRWLFPAIRRREPRPPLTWVIVVAWTGMRGVVSLAAALALPLTLADGRTPFPERALVQYITFWAIFGTLVVQGLTLPYLLCWLGVKAEPAPEPHG
jgi:CPA1 family monovalent cation:H+ antiporter